MSGSRVFIDSDMHHAVYTMFGLHSTMTCYGCYCIIKINMVMLHPPVHGSYRSLDTRKLNIICCLAY